MRNKIIVHSPEVKNKNKLVCKFTTTARVRKFFCTNYFFAEYDRDISEVPESILTIPILANILPISWLYDSDIIVDSLDENFCNCLKNIKQVFARMYPYLKWRGSISANYSVNNEIQNNNSSSNNNKSAVLFSGGIDSLFSFINHRNENLNLISVWGADIHLFNKELFKKLIYEIKNFAEFNKVESLVIKTNFVEFINQHLLYSYYYEELPSRPSSWYNSIQHGIGLLGLCAPLTKTENFKSLYIASTYSNGLKLPYGSDPELDNSLKWSNVNIIHDGYEFSRQDKINAIADYLKTENYKIKIHVCYSYLKELNCSKCEKCSRTIIGLMAAGLNPNDYGFEISKDIFFRTKDKLINGSILTNLGLHFYWNDIKRKINMENIYNIEGSTEFFKWLENTPLEDRGNKKNDKDRLSKRILRKAIKYFYPVFNIIYKILPKEPLYKLYFQYLYKQNK